MKLLVNLFIKKELIYLIYSVNENNYISQLPIGSFSNENFVFIERSQGDRANFYTTEPAAMNYVGILIN